MREALRPERVANAIRQRRQVLADRAYLVVEGDTDRRLMAKFVDPARCEIEVAMNRDFVLGVVAELARTHTPGVLALIDADFDPLDGVDLPPNVVRTDTHDIETLTLRSPALDHVLREHGSDEKRTLFERRRAPIREALLQACLPLGYLRWHSRRASLALTFRDLDMSKLLGDDLNPNRTDVIRYILQRSQKPLGLLTECSAAIEALEDSRHDRWVVCCGHDLVAALSNALRKTLGTRASNDVSPDVIERDLRLAFERRDLEETDLYTAVRRWEADNAPFVIFAP
jgi:Protein of unknown function (DUF4435)